MQFEIASKTLVVTLAKISDFIRHNTGNNVALPANPDKPDAGIELDDMRKGAVSKGVGKGQRTSEQADSIRSCSQVNGLIRRPIGEGIPAVDLSHGDLAGSQQSPEQHRGCFRARQHGLRLDPAFELFV